MLNTCPACGAYHADQIVIPAGPLVICPACGARRPFVQLPLFLVGGASGAGKTAVLHSLLGRVPEGVLLEGDLLWRPEFNQPADNYRDFYETWLRLAKSIGQSGRPVVLFNAGAIPQNVEPCVERRYFAEIHYLALVCDDALLAERLEARPSWRESSGADFIAAQQAYNRWLQENATTTDPPITLLDTSAASVAETATAVRRWISNDLDQRVNP